MAWIMDGKYRPWRFFGWFERRVDSGPQTWKQYTASLLIFNTVLFVFGYIVLALQPWMPLNPRGLGMLAPTTIFHSVVSFMTNTDLQHYSGDQHLSNFSQIVWAISNLFLSAAIGLSALVAIIRALRSDPTWATSSSTCGGRSCTCSCPPPSFSPSSSWSRAAP